MPETASSQQIHPKLAEALACLNPNDAPLKKALAVVKALRTPKTGCPWDLEQTHHSLRAFMLEEAYEATEAMAALKPDATPSVEQAHHLKDELGDVLLQVLLNAQIADDAGLFDFQDVCENLAQKLIHRHPHVFNETQVAGIDNPEAVTQQWQAIKAREKGEQASVLDGVGHGLPALARAAKISRKAVKAGFTWPDDETLWACVMSEFQELKDELETPTRDPQKLEDEMGDVFFACASLSKHIGVDPELAVAAATQKFEKRFREMEKLIAADGNKTACLSFDEWEAYWAKAKASLRKQGLCS